MKLLTPIFIAAALLVIIVGTKGIQKPNVSQSLPSSAPPKVAIVGIPRITTIATGLDTPWALAFLPDGSLLVTERPGRVRLVSTSGKLQPNPLLTIPDVITYPQGEAGLMGIAVSPAFHTNHFVYLYYTYLVTSGDDHNRLVRYELVNSQLINSSILLDNVPGNVRHDGGRLKFGPDGYIYLTTGDSLVPSRSQDKKSLAGKILQLTADGKPAPGNPFGNEVYSYGHRNPQGIAWDTAGQLYEVEHGDTAHDEINKILIGANYGWPVIQGSEAKSGMVTPLKNSENDTWAPGGLAYIDNAWYFGELKGTALGKFTISRDNVSYTAYFSGEFGRIRDVITAPNGMLYLTTSNRDGRATPAPDDDKIIRVNPEKL